MTRILSRHGAAACLLGLTLPAVATAHEDDPKILDRRPPVAGTGFTAANAAALGGTTAAAGLFNSAGIGLSSWLTLSDLGVPTANGNDCWGYVSPSGREYALMGTTVATIVVEVTNPAAPAVIGTIPGHNSFWRDIKVYGERAYAISEDSGGVQVIDLSNVDNGIVALENTIVGQGTDATHNVVIDEVSGFLYRCGGGNNGLRIYSLANPGNPQFVGSYSSRYVHDAQVVTYTSGPFAGRQIAFCCAGLNGGFDDTGLTILDVTNKSNIVTLSQVSYPDNEYSHQGWLSEDLQYFYLGDELDERAGISETTTRIFDVSDLNNAALVGVFDNGLPSVGHNMYSLDGLLYQANYTSGLRVFDYETDPLNPTEVAFIDTVNGTNGNTFNGLWSVYPYFPSGTIIGSDIESGLFVLQLELLRIRNASDVGLIDPAGESVTIDVTGEGGGAVNASTVRLFYDVGAGFTSVTMNATGSGDEYSGAFPPIACGTSVDYYFQATSISGDTVTFPTAGASAPFSAVVADGLSVVRSDDMESAAGWSSGAAGDDATTGLWTRGDPNGTNAQPEVDRSPVGAQCWFTGQAAPGAGLGNNDVDGGSTTLLTPVFDASTASEPSVSYWRWYSNGEGGNPNADTFDIAISNDGGTNWTALESVGPAGPGTSGGWINVSFRIADFVTPTSQMRVRFVASDTGGGSIVEAAIDDFEVNGVECGPDQPGVEYCAANANSTGQVGTIDGVGSSVAADNDLTLFASSLPVNQFGFFVASQTQGFAPNLAGGDGNLCLAGSLGRYAFSIQNSGLFGQIVQDIDTSAIPEAGAFAAAVAGDTWNWQCWHRDVNGSGPTSNFTRGYSVVFQ